MTKNHNNNNLFYILLVALTIHSNLASAWSNGNFRANPIEEDSHEHHHHDDNSRENQYGDNRESAVSNNKYTFEQKLLDSCRGAETLEIGSSIDSDVIILAQQEKQIKIRINEEACNHNRYRNLLQVEEGEDDVWFTIEGKGSGVGAYFCTESQDEMVAVYVYRDGGGECTNLECVAVSVEEVMRDDCEESTTRTSWFANEGEKYNILIRSSSYNEDKGEMNPVRIDIRETKVENDTCENAKLINGNNGNNIKETISGKLTYPLRISSTSTSTSSSNVPTNVCNSMKDPLFAHTNTGLWYRIEEGKRNPLLELSLSACKGGSSSGGQIGSRSDNSHQSLSQIRDDRPSLSSYGISILSGNCYDNNFKCIGWFPCHDAIDTKVSLNTTTLFEDEEVHNYYYMLIQPNNIAGETIDFTIGISSSSDNATRYEEKNQLVFILILLLGLAASCFLWWLPLLLDSYQFHI